MASTPQHSDPYFDPFAGTLCVDVEGSSEEDIFAAMHAAADRVLAGLETGEFVSAPAHDCLFSECPNPGTLEASLVVDGVPHKAFACVGCALEILV